MEQKKVLIIGSSVSALQWALGQADASHTVYLVEKAPGVRGNGASLSAKWEEASQHKNIHIITNALINNIRKEGDGFSVKILKTAPRVIAEKCNDCKECIKVCPITLRDDYNQGLSYRTAIDFFNTLSRSYSIIRERPVCEETCPVHLDIRGYVGLIADGKFTEALDLIREKLPFPATIGRICPHPCEEKCNRGKVDAALCIRDLKRFAAVYDRLTQEPEAIPLPESNGKRVAIIGSGPAGLTCAHDLARSGYAVTVFEALPLVGGMLAVGIPQYRLPRAILNAEIDVVRRLGVEIRTHCRIGDGVTLDDLFKQGYQAVFIAVGCHNSLPLGIPNEDSEGVIHGVHFLRDLSLGKEVKAGKRVAIIGGGNVAMDAARSCLRLGSEEVSIVYRRSRQEMPASDEEIEAALKEGMRIEYLVAPMEVIVTDGRVSGLKCIRMQLGEADASGRRRPIPVEGSEVELDLDMIIPAIGQKSDLSFLSGDNAVTISRWGTIITDADSLSTEREGVFAGGDCVTGPWIAIEAVAAGKKAARAIDNYLKGK